MAVLNFPVGVVSKYAVRLCPGCGCDLRSCGCSSGSLDVSSVDYLSSLMGHIPNPLDVAAIDGGAGVTDGTLIAWTEGEAYQLLSIQYDPIDTDLIVSADVLWPDGSTGVLNITYVGGYLDSYTITHVASSKTITQGSVTRNIDGYITSSPALTVA
jgi:hypothetical protein